MKKLKQFVTSHRTALIRITALTLLIATLTVIFNDHIKDWSIYIRFLIFFGVFVGFAVRLTPQQYRQALRPWDPYTHLRWYLVGILITIVLTLTTPIMNQFLALQGIRYDWLRDISAIMGAVNLLALYVFFELSLNYKRKDK